MIIRSKDVPCAVCGAQAGEQCTFAFGARRGKTFRFSSHSRRAYDAGIAENTANVLLND